MNLIILGCQTFLYFDYRISILLNTPQLVYIVNRVEDIEFTGRGHQVRDAGDLLQRGIVIYYDLTVLSGLVRRPEVDGGGEGGGSL